jgi:hypothetical protein
LEIDRKLGKERVPQIICRSYDPTTREAIEARFPTAKDKVTTGIGTIREEAKAFTIPGITDVATLRRCAENAYNTLARGESMIRFTTPVLQAADDKGVLHDLLALQAGRAVSLGFDPYVADAVLQSATTEQRFTHLVAAGLRERVARLIATEYDKINYFKKPFYIREVSLNFDAESGIQIEVEAVNFIAVNRDEKKA